MALTINDEIILGIVEDYTESNMVAKQIAAKYNVSVATVYRSLKEMGVGLRRNTKSSKEVLETKPVVPASKSKFNKIGCGESVICGLVSERHDMPANVNLYIFERYLNPMVQFDFEGQYNVARDFIMEHVYQDSKPIKDLLVYCTGIQSALAAVIKAAFDLRVNLILAHYDSQYDKYRYQLMWGEFTETPITNNVIRFINNSSSYCYYNCNHHDISDTIFLVTFILDGDKKSYICASMADAYDIYFTSLKNASICLNAKFILYADEFTVNENGKFIKTVLMQSKN